MPDDLSYKEVEALASEYDKTLKASDKRFSNFVVLNFEDGSYFHIRSAFIMQKKNWIIVFTEHYGTHIYDKDELNYYGEYETFKSVASDKDDCEI